MNVFENIFNMIMDVKEKNKEQYKSYNKYSFILWLSWYNVV